MQQRDVRFAAAARRRVRQLRWLTVCLGVAAAASSAALALPFSHFSGSASASPAAPGSAGAASAGSGPAGTSPGSGSLQAPAQGVVPATGPVQGVSGGS